MMSVVSWTRGWRRSRRSSRSKRVPVEGSGDTASLHRLKRAVAALEKMQLRIAELESVATEPIAIVGIGVRMPGGGDTPEAFWKLLRDGVDATSEVPPDRWDVNAYYDPNPDAPGKMYT